MQGPLLDQSKILRIGVVLQQLIEHLHDSDLDPPARLRLRSIHNQSILELKDCLSDELYAEMRRIARPLRAKTPSTNLLLIEFTQLSGWVEGLFHCLQAETLGRQMLESVDQLTVDLQPDDPTTDEPTAAESTEI